MIYGYINENVGLPQLVETAPAPVLSDGKDYHWITTRTSVIDHYFIDRLYSRSENGQIIQSQDDANACLLATICPGDIVITSSIINFASEYTRALSIVSDIHKKQVRFISILEELDTSSDSWVAILNLLPFFKKCSKNAQEARQAQIRAGISRSKKSGTYNHAPAMKPSDFPLFPRYYQEYMRRMMTKVQFAEKLNITRPTLDKLILQYRKELENENNQ